MGTSKLDLGLLGNSSRQALERPSCPCYSYKKQDCLERSRLSYTTSDTNRPRPAMEPLRLPYPSPTTTTCPSQDSQRILK